MTKKEFREKMFECKKGIMTNGGGFCCDNLGWTFQRYSFPVLRVFRFLFKRLNHFWWNESFNRKNQLMRIDALSFFEEYCITEGIYKEF